MGLDRILHGERMQVELRSDVGELRRVGPVETDPRDPFALAAGGIEPCQALGRSDSLPVTIDSAVNDDLGPSLRGCHGSVHAVYHDDAARRPAQVSCAVSPLPALRAPDLPRVAS